MSESENLLTLWDKPLAAAQIPKYPGPSLKIAKGGESTYFTANETPLGGGRIKVTVGERLAEPGEKLRDSTLKYIPDWNENRLHRIMTRARADKDPAWQEIERLRCKSSLLYFANTYCWCIDQRLMGPSRKTPFVSWDFQDDVLTWIVWLIKHGRMGLIEKSRDMGCSWMAVIIAAWLALFYEDMESVFMSMTEIQVDNRTSFSLLGKVRFLINNCPEWMRGGFTERNYIHDREMSITIPATRSLVTGQLSRSTAGRAGRATVVFPDEFAHVEDSENVLYAISELANSKVFISTPKGAGNAFHRMAFEPGVNKKTLHWTLNPTKNGEWAKWKKGEPDMTEEVWAQEQEIQYELSVTGRVFPQFIFLPDEGAPWMHVQDCEDARYEPQYDTYSTSDLGISDPCSTLWAQMKPVRPQWQAFTPVTLWFFEEHELRNMGALDLRWLLNSKGYKYKKHIADMRTGRSRDSSGRTWEINMADSNAKAVYSKAFRQIIPPGPPVLIEGYRPLSTLRRAGGSIEIFRKCLATPGLIGFNKYGCKHAIQAIQNWSFPIDKETRKPKTDVEPIDDQWSHACKAILYLCAFLFSNPAGQSKPAEEWNFPAFKLRVR